MLMPAPRRRFSPCYNELPFSTSKGALLLVPCIACRDMQTQLLLLAPSAQDLSQWGLQDAASRLIGVELDHGGVPHQVGTAPLPA